MVIDIDRASRKIDLPREVKVKIQVAVSKMEGKKIRKLLEYLGDMRYTAMNKKDYKMAAYCRAVKEFVDKYYKTTYAKGKVGKIY